MALNGNVAGKLLRGRINSIDTLILSAYAIAVKNGFEGTEEEWLASLKGAQGEPGKDGAGGKDGTSATHSWNGTVLTVTSSSGTSSADLKGEKGDPGKDAVYVGSGDMPDGYDIQIDPNGEADEFATREYVNAQIQAAINDTWEGSY